MKIRGLILGAFLVSLIALCGCSRESNEEHVGKHIDIQMPDVLNIEYTDDHGGFHGDGTTFAKIQFDKENAANIITQIVNHGSWRTLPLTENLNLAMYGGEKDQMEYGYRFAEKVGIPEIQNGYWFFLDRHSESTSPQTDADLFNRSSFNFTLALYDTDENTLYYFEFDT